MGSVLERISPDFKIPYDEAALTSGDPTRTAAYLLELVETLQLLLNDIVTVANFSLSLADGEAVYYALQGSDGTYPDGTWRRIQVGNNLEVQVKLDGVWTLTKTEERPI